MSDDLATKLARDHGRKVITDPVRALVEVGTENTQLHDELQRVYSELDHFRRALTIISDAPGRAGQVARDALALRPLGIS